MLKNSMENDLRKAGVRRYGKHGEFGVKGLQKRLS